MTPHIPQELIVDFLYDDRKALTRCALVSRNWVDTAYMHLGEKITPLNSPSRLPSLTIFALALPSSPHIQRYTKHLYLYSPPKSHTRINLEALSSALENLPHLETLTCRNIELVLLPQRSNYTSRHIDTPLRVPHVRFHKAQFTSYETGTSALHNLLSRLQSTQTLSLSHPSYGSGELSLFIPAKTKATPQTLVAVTSVNNMADLLILVRNTVDLFSVSNYGTCFASHDDVALVGSFLQESLRHISKLEINLLNLTYESTTYSP